MTMSRRTFVRTIAAAGIALQQSALGKDLQTRGNMPQPATDPSTQPSNVVISWLGGTQPAECPGVTWGVPWPRGNFPKEQTFRLTGDNNVALPLQTWPLAFWPDGSLKWTAHATTSAAAQASALKVMPGLPQQPTTPITVKETADAIEISTGVVRSQINKTGGNLIESIERDGKLIVTAVQLIALRQDAPTLEFAGNLKQEAFTSAINKVTLEQCGPVRAVVKLEGTHAGPNQRQWLPFTIRLYFYAGSESVRMMHSFIFDGDETKDFIRGLGVRFSVPMHDLPHDRHIRFAGENGGLWAEASRNLSGLRRDPGGEVIARQLAGLPCPPVETFATSVSSRLQFIPQWDAFSLFQSTSDAFTIRKRTAGESVSWITAGHGNRAPGLGYVGGPSGGCAFGLRDFWQRHPTQLDVKGVTTDSSEVTLWLWSPSSPAMDLRFYHDEMGMDTHAKQLEALEITYEDYEPGYGTPHGIARTSELTLWALPATPTRERLVQMAGILAAPPVLVCAPEHYHECDLFGGIWSLPDRSTPHSAFLEDRLDWYFEYYRNQVEQRRWYGFWDYGDIMHTYDHDRHCWRYDVGGYAWDNSELSPDLWLWYSFLRTGSEKIFRFAEAMTRHTGEVDVYHAGPFAMLGSRHNVQHWGCSAKQLRISTAVYRRFYYFLTADERIGDLMHALVDADKTFLTTDPIRKIRKGEYHPQPHALSVGMGTDWGSLAVAWLAEWERTGDARCKMKIINGMKSLAALPHGLFTAGGSYDPDTGLFTNMHGNEADISHLNAVFGLPEIFAELISLFDVPEFEKAWLDYCEYYNADEKTRAAALGFHFKTQTLTNAHSRLTAYAAWKKQDPALAQRAWKEFYADDWNGVPQGLPSVTHHITGPAVLIPVDEAPWVSTNNTAQWSLSAIENLEMVAKYLPPAVPAKSGV